MSVVNPEKWMPEVLDELHGYLLATYGVNTRRREDMMDIAPTARVVVEAMGAIASCGDAITAARKVGASAAIVEALFKKALREMRRQGGGG